MHRELVGERAREVGLDDIADELMALVSTGWRLDGLSVTAQGGAVGRSRLGGEPDLPDHASWPIAPGSSSAPGAPMAFVGQIQLAELRGGDWPGPRSGLLSFFCARDPESEGVWGKGSARVLHLAAGVELRRRAWPTAVVQANRFRETNVTLKEWVMLPELEAVEPALALERLGFGSSRTEAEEAAYTRLRQWLAHAQDPIFSDPEASPGEPVIVPYWGCDRLAGHADHIQGDPLLDCAVASLGREGMPGDYDDEALGRVGDWRHLLQLFADVETGMTWADDGAIFFCMPSADLSEGRFDRVEAAMQCL
jgi:hypothetical protein